MRIIPAIDIIDGKCVRLSKGDYQTKKIYNENPLEVAKQFQDAGIQYLHVVDLDGAKSNHIVNHAMLEKICRHTNLKVDFGGGLKSNDDLRIAFESGANQITAGSIAIKNPPLFFEWLQEYGSNKIILGADCNQRKIVTNGWLEHSEIDVIDFITEKKAMGIQQVICTDVSKDGMLIGSSIDLYKEILKELDISLIASGGVTSIKELKQLSEIGCEGTIIGKAIYEGNISLKELEKLC
ncbi:1-(5-phosphoribosyl)-5-[(5-phosphoribosylamino)methylideneamino]imidazole-4-carboxamide isomerase [Lentimicrobium sp. S6]|nr:1-(5-phosphoribosyl)-5-[(5-phosphoribosylamino)methylideneamino]imidazole-4-carboxamide isomerase [Lentimicrobium sp. S6]NPD45753.1 1-(5-phosphoribosyl)-5-[(5-phosphoribosylamino)methylideneamino]imidazole-4-carboxamide isomerase [Lentimicrobium sp. S6]